jgi:sugar transferase (PEP-CTERM system associated)|tara:strand:+ start:13934 stop:15316 length:1383 start_codon:yes stop_codon:yes gene_type:complete
VIRLFKHYLPRPLLILGLFEMVLVFAAAVLAWKVAWNLADADMPPMRDHLLESLIYTVTVYTMMLGFGAYQLSSFRSFRMTGARLSAAMLMSIVILSLLLLVAPTLDVWRSVLFFAVVFSFLFIVLTRILFLAIIGWRRFREPIIVIGTGAQGRRMVERSEDPTAGFRIVKQLSLSRVNAEEGSETLQDIPSLADFCARNEVEEIVLALDERRGSLPTDTLLKAKLSGVRVTDMSTFLERMTGRVDLESVRPSWLIFSDGFLGSSTGAVVSKRLFDLIASGLLLLLSSPILLVSALAVRLSSPGPIFYRQERVGQFGKVFEVMKFRSMVQDAEKDGAVWAQKGDARVTSVGRVIRATRIDEIPQIFNVFKGDMSFVGPRPERPVFVEQLSRQIPFYDERHVVKPGITGWAQLNYPYGASVEDARHKLEYDLYYIKNYSLFLDIVTLIQTVRVVVWQDGVR